MLKTVKLKYIYSAASNLGGHFLKGKSEFQEKLTASLQSPLELQLLNSEGSSTTHSGSWRKYPPPRWWRKEFLSSYHFFACVVPLSLGPGRFPELVWVGSVRRNFIFFFFWAQRQEVLSYKEISGARWMEEAGGLEKNSGSWSTSFWNLLMRGHTEKRYKSTKHELSVGFPLYKDCVCVHFNHCISESTWKLEKVNTLTRIRRFLGGTHTFKNKNTFSYNINNE